ncbi:MAG TPA: hypothetical protein VMZ29_03630 [Candidatus Bathyarchaeia archaeon]|nr:hypothetical protein [Candidatus Bathyarchaeia archaeon]
MKPKCLCLIYVGPKGLEKIRSYPEILKKKIENKIILASFPSDPTQNNFNTTMIENYFITSYLFSISDEEKSNYFLFVAAYDKILEDPDSIRDFFVKIIDDHKIRKTLSIKQLANSMPEIYQRLGDSYIKTKVDGRVTIEISTSSRNKKKKEKKDKFDEDLWGEE